MKSNVIPLWPVGSKEELDARVRLYTLSRRDDPKWQANVAKLKEYVRARNERSP